MLALHAKDAPHDHLEPDQPRSSQFHGSHDTDAKQPGRVLHTCGKAVLLRTRAKARLLRACADLHVVRLPLTDCGLGGAADNMSSGLADATIAHRPARPAANDPWTSSRPRK